MTLPETSGRRPGIALATYLEPLTPFLADPTATEISINRPGEVWVENQEGVNAHPVAGLDYGHLIGLAGLIADHNDQVLSEEKPLLAGELPSGERVQVVRPPACEDGGVALSIRKHTFRDLHLQDYLALGAFSDTNAFQPDQLSEADQTLVRLYQDGEFIEFVRQAVMGRKNVIVSGGTNTGKTTFLNACLKAIPPAERLITIEDTGEVRPIHRNWVRLLYPRGRNQGLGTHTAQDLLEASLRLRPDRIILGELRGAEAFSYLRAINTGHPGSLTSVHADTPRLCLEQIGLMVMQAGTGLTRQEILDYVRALVEVVIQVKRRPDGHRYISDIYYAHA